MVKPLRNPNRFAARLKRQSERQSIDITYLIYGSPGSGPRMILGKGSDNTVFLPAVLHPGGHDGALVKAGLDNVAVGENQGKLYVPADWLRKQMAGDPQASHKIAIIDRMVAAVKAYSA